MTTSSPPPQPAIQLLSQSMINKIAAGEVIERPASVVKELLENAVDAGARRIDVSVEKGGIDMIRVVDDGCGIAVDQLPLALSPHATSKISDTEDLFRIRSFGFRGEALASIAEVSQMILRSRVAASTEGAEIRSEGGGREVPKPVGHPVGTTIEVRNLFFNTPVRRKYMKSVTTEFGHVVETFTRMALPHIDIHWTLRHNDRVIHDLPTTGDPLTRIGKLFGPDIAEHLIDIATPPGEVAVRGYVCHPNHSRGNNRMQYFFLNRRFIKDRSLQHALVEAYRGLLTVGRYPIAFLELDMLPELFDVNVHPTKMEVRFLDSNRVYSRFLSAIREKFLQTDLHGRPTLPGRTEAPTSETSPSGAAVDPRDPRTAMDAGTVEALRQKVLDWARRPAPEADTGNIDGANARLQEVAEEDDNAALRVHRVSPPTSLPPQSSRRSNDLEPRGIPGDTLSAHMSGRVPDFRPFGKMDHSPSLGGETTTVSGLNIKQDIDANPLSEDVRDTPARISGSFDMPEDPVARKSVQMHDRYLVLETPEGIAIVDQHALHERLVFEQLKRQTESGRLETQGLLVPVPIDLSPIEAACVLENRDFLRDLGIGIDPFGGNTMLLTSYPAMLESRDPKEILLGLLEPLLVAGKKSNRAELLEELLHQMACKAAVKAGDRLSELSIDELFARASEEEQAHHCPHGRPSMLVFTCEELDRMFRR